MIIFDMSFFRFGIAGLCGMGIDFVTTWICKEKIKLDKFLSSSIGFCLAVTNNFLLNRYWTFGSVSSPFVVQFMKFFIVSLSGLLLNNLVLFLLVKNSKLNFYLLKAVVVAFIFGWNYFINRTITFN